MANWISNVKSRGKCICHEEVGHRSASICHLTNIAYRLRRELDWDPQAEKFVGDEEANKQIGEPMRGDWKLS